MPTIKWKKKKKKRILLKSITYNADHAYIGETTKSMSNQAT